MTVAFNKDSAHDVRWDVPTISYFSSILEAYTSASSPVIIKVWGTDFSGDVTFSENKAITISGGYNSDYTANTGQTVVKGKLTIQKGSLRVNGVKVRPQ